MLPEPKINAATLPGPRQTPGLQIDIARHVPTTEHNAETVITVCGEIDIATEGHFRSAIESVLTPGQRLIIDLNGTTFMGCCAIRILLAAVADLGNDRSAVVVRRPTRQVRRLLQHTHLDSNITIEPSP